MPEHIDVPPTLTGDEQNQLQQIWRYLYGLSEILNRNMANIGGNELTDRERVAMRGIVDTQQINSVESLRDMVVNIADYVRRYVKEAGNRIVKITVVETDETDFNDLEESGNYWTDMSEMAHGPSGVSSGTGLLEVEAGAGIIRQILTMGSAIHIRTQNTETETWGSWNSIS